MKKTIQKIIILCIALTNFGCSNDDSDEKLKPDFIFESANIICPISSSHQVSWEANIINIGKESGSVSVQGWLSTDNALGNDVAAGGLVFGNLEPEESVSRNFGATVGTNIADYNYLLLQIDHNELEDELDETNNLITIEIPTGYPYVTCKPENYADIALGNIQFNEDNLSGDSIEATNADGNIFKTGDVLIYKTNEGRYGKLEVLSIDDADNKKLAIKAVTYTNDGSIYKETSFLEIRGTWSADLDELIEAPAGQISIQDFWWERINTTDTDFTPENDAKYYMYSF